MLLNNCFYSCYNVTITWAKPRLSSSMRATKKAPSLARPKITTQLSNRIDNAMMTTTIFGEIIDFEGPFVAMSVYCCVNVVHSDPQIRSISFIRIFTFASGKSNPHGTCGMLRFRDIPVHLQDRLARYLCVFFVICVCFSLRDSCISQPYFNFHSSSEFRTVAESACPSDSSATTWERRMRESNV